MSQANVKSKKNDSAMNFSFSDINRTASAQKQEAQLFENQIVSPTLDMAQIDEEQIEFKEQTMKE